MKLFQSSGTKRGHEGTIGSVSDSRKLTRRVLFEVLNCLP